MSETLYMRISTQNRERQADRQTQTDRQTEITAVTTMMTSHDIMIAGQCQCC